MTVWLVATLALLPPPLAALIAAGRGAAGARLVALELAASLATFALVAMSFAFDQPSSIDLALTLALLALPGTVLFCMFEERWRDVACGGCAGTRHRRGSARSRSSGCGRRWSGSTS